MQKEGEDHSHNLGSDRWENKRRKRTSKKERRKKDKKKKSPMWLTKNERNKRKEKRREKKREEEQQKKKEQRTKRIFQLSYIPSSSHIPTTPYHQNPTHHHEHNFNQYQGPTVQKRYYSSDINNKIDRTEGKNKEKNIEK